jgi:DNA helicase-2/ATP-dependent DNA helicase PcrA
VTDTVSARDIAAALGLPEPTPQQVAVIESDLAPSLVIAGAGSGKTETMANRVLWLLANRKVEQSQVLGLTFTRKAAGELSRRIRDRIAQLQAAGMLGADHDPFDAPTVATYNSYANALYRDNSTAIGREGDGVVLGEAAAWQLARSIVIRSTDDRLPGLGKNLEGVTKAVLGLSRAIAENLIDPDRDKDRRRVRELALRFAGLGELPLGGGQYAEALKHVEAVAALDTLVDLAAELEAAKLARGLIEYSDQVALALQIVRKQPGVAAEERAKYRVVLLDEYQDTSVGQTWLLAELFGGHPTMAVGDPNQSIYGWRGASANNLGEFPRLFGSSEVFPLSTSWRNGRVILDAANVLVAPFVASSRVPVEKLRPRPGASEEPVEVFFGESVAEEAAAVAVWLERELVRPGKRRSAALLMRARKTQPFFLAALRERGIPYHVLGIGGLMAEPEIADLVAALSVVDDASAGVELLRLLSGSRWRIGVQDLHALHRLSSWLQARDLRQQPLDDEVRELLKSSVADGDAGSIVDALDFVSTAPDGHAALSTISETGLNRLRDAGRVISRLRSRTGLDLPDFVSYVIHELQLDIEVAANEARPLGTSPTEAFFDALTGYLAIDDRATLGGFLGWLREAELREDLAPRPEDPEPGTVQVLTIHGAKGLEWDAVAVPRLVVDELPAKPVDGTGGWLRFGELPWPFRGDVSDLPQLAWESVTTRKEFDTAVKDFKVRVRAHLDDEERRLAYVAVTRARDNLLLSGSFWATQVAPRSPSVFLRELAGAGVIPEPPAASALDENPLGDDLEIIHWPLDPLGSRRESVEAAAEVVRAARPALAGPWARELELLLEERRRRLGASELIPLPVRVPASRFKDFVTDPGSVASSLRRPMPERPYRATQLGTLFHAWVENRYGAGGDSEELDALPGESDADDYVDAPALAQLQAIFEASPWAGRRPVDVEREIHLPFDGRIVICKIDAVYSLDDADRFEIVDWKTGRAPKDEQDLEEKQLQLALYRLAYAKWKGIDPDRIDALFYYVADDAIIRPERLFDEQELLERWRSALA